jgi:hypothetical protein
MQSRISYRSCNQHKPDIKLESQRSTWVGAYLALCWLDFPRGDEEVEEQRKLLDKKDPLAPSVCTGAFTRSYGLPCAHKIKMLQDRNQGLQIGDFHY